MSQKKASKPKRKPPVLKFPKRPFVAHSLEPSATLQQLQNLTSEHNRTLGMSCGAQPLEWNNRRRPLLDRLQQALLIAPAVVDQAIDEIIFVFGQLEKQHDGSEPSAVSK